MSNEKKINFNDLKNYFEKIEDEDVVNYLEEGDIYLISSYDKYMIVKYITFEETTDLGVDYRKKRDDSREFRKLTKEEKEKIREKERIEYEQAEKTNKIANTYLKFRCLFDYSKRDDEFRINPSRDDTSYNFRVYQFFLKEPNPNSISIYEFDKGVKDVNQSLYDNNSKSVNNFIHNIIENGGYENVVIPEEEKYADYDYGSNPPSPMFWSDNDEDNEDNEDNEENKGGKKIKKNAKKSKKNKKKSKRKSKNTIVKKKSRVNKKNKKN